MYKILTFILPLLATPLIAQDMFPELVGETAAGETITLPPKGDKRTVIGFAYSQKAEPKMQEWMEPAYLRLVAKHGLFADTYDAEVWFVPMFLGANKAAYNPVLNKFRKSADPEVAEHILFYKGELEPLDQALGLGKDDIPYFFVLDEKGRIIHRTEGSFSVEKLDAIEEHLME